MTSPKLFLFSNNIKKLYLHSEKIHYYKMDPFHIKNN